VNSRKIRIIAPVLDSIFIIRTCIFENKCHIYTLEVFNKKFLQKNLKISELQFSQVDSADMLCLPYPALTMITMVVYFYPPPHLSDNYVDLSDNYVHLSDIYVDLSDDYVDSVSWNVSVLKPITDIYLSA
jgi:hypothetical protein